ncbi:MAG TPA: cysteine desulfurase family protein, partial [Thiohalobacter sp.]|nr:cysteine desulfurase family protein [Thiohalobacter sp.]
PWLREHFGNPSSEHVIGRRAAEAVGEARAAVAGLLGAPPAALFFTGCATEANNLALRGVARALRGRGRHLIISAVEHPSVTGPAERLRAGGWDLTVLPVDAYGRVDPQALAAELRPDTVLVSVMLANNETGTLQPVAGLSALTRPRGILLHTDAAQAVGKIPVDVDTLGVDLLTLAGHKFYAPKGVGALYVRPGTAIEPLLVGGGQELGLRPGTENVPHIVALGTAASLSAQNLEQESARLRRLRDRLHDRLQAAIAGLRLNGHPEQRLPNTLNLSFPDVTGRALLDAVGDRIAASVGSACHEDSGAVSGVLAAMGLPPERARGAVRLSLGRFTRDGDIARAADILRQAHARLSPQD